MSVDKITTDMAKPREAALRGTAADLIPNGLDMFQGTRTLSHTHKAPTAVAATSSSSLRPDGVFSKLPRRFGRVYASPLVEAATT